MRHAIAVYVDLYTEPAKVYCRTPWFPRLYVFCLVGASLLFCFWAGSSWASPGICGLPWASLGFPWKIWAPSLVTTSARHAVAGRLDLYTQLARAYYRMPCCFSVLLLCLVWYRGEEGGGVDRARGGWRRVRVMRDVALCPVAGGPCPLADDQSGSPSNMSWVTLGHPRVF